MAPVSERPGRRCWALAFAGLLLACGVLVLRARSRGAARQPVSTVEEETATPARPDRSARTRAFPEQWLLDQQAATDKASRPASKIPDELQKYALYPPTSRPVTPARAAAFKYNHRVLQFLPVMRPGEKKPAFYSALTADKVMVFAGETIAITLKVARDAQGSAEQRPVTILSSGLTKGRRTDAPKVGELPLEAEQGAADGQAGHAVFAAVVDPSKIAELADFHGSVRAFVEYSVDGTAFAHQLFFDLYPKSGIGARLTGKFREAVEDGSLVVYAELDVLRAGHYSLDATLLDPKGDAFCHSRFKGALDTGTREARLLFFGKVIRDAAPPVESPFTVAEIYGQMVPEPEQLLEMSKSGSFAPFAVPLYAGVHTTRRYDIRDFSNAPWRRPIEPTASAEAGNGSGPRI